MTCKGDFCLLCVFFFLAFSESLSDFETPAASVGAKDIIPTKFSFFWKLILQNLGCIFIAMKPGRVTKKRYLKKYFFKALAAKHFIAMQPVCEVSQPGSESQ